jgi:hypothetical protein
MLLLHHGSGSNPEGRAGLTANTQEKRRNQANSQKDSEKGTKRGAKIDTGCITAIASLSAPALRRGHSHRFTSDLAPRRGKLHAVANLGNNPWVAPGQPKPSIRQIGPRASDPTGFDPSHPMKADR